MPKSFLELSDADEFVDVPPDAMRKTLIEVGLPDWQADGLIEDYAHYSRSEAAEVTTGVRDATGRPPRSFDDFACDYAYAFLRPSRKRNRRRLAQYQPHYTGLNPLDSRAPARR